jgi:hypothetical protein
MGKFIHTGLAELFTVRHLENAEELRQLFMQKYLQNTSCFKKIAFRKLVLRVSQKGVLRRIFKITQPNYKIKSNIFCLEERQKLQEL